MNIEAFTKAYREPRNGCKGFIRHQLARQFAYSDGIQECAEAGLYWLLDIVATELPPVFQKSKEIPGMASIYVKAKGCRAELRAEFDEGIVAWRRKINFTDLPDGEWVFLMVDEGAGATPYRMILLSEN